MNTHFTEKIVVLGSTGYVGQAFESELTKRSANAVYLSRHQVDYTNYRSLREFLQTEKPTFLVCCAGFTGKPNVDACESKKADTILGNVTLPLTVANACESSSVPWGHVSSGCIYAGAKLKTSSGDVSIEKDLMRPEVRSQWGSRPEALEGFRESDPPNFSFRDPPCSFYSGTKALGEEVLQDRENLFVWRLRIPFDHIDSPRNYLTKVQKYARVYDNVNSLSHRHEFAQACLDTWLKRAPFGIYNVTNTGWVTTREVVEILAAIMKLNRTFQYFEDDTDFYQVAATPRSNTILENSKLRSVGVHIRDVREAVEAAARDWIKS